MMIQVCSDFVIAALEERMKVCEERGWVSEAAEALWQQALDMVEACGIGENCTSPSYFVDNYCINGEFYSKEEWMTQNNTDEDEEWRQFCEDECILYNEDFACRQF